VRVAVCDDEDCSRCVTKEAIDSYSNLHRLEIAVCEFASGEDLLQSSLKYNVIFLDYKMGGINGLETAKFMRQNNVDSTIIFLTSYPDFVYESFDVSTFRF